jgi:hypothetical protein
MVGIMTAIYNLEHSIILLEQCIIVAITTMLIENIGVYHYVVVVKDGSGTQRLVFFYCGPLKYTEEWPKQYNPILEWDAQPLCELGNCVLPLDLSTEANRKRATKFYQCVPRTKCLELISKLDPEERFDIVGECRMQTRYVPVNDESYALFRTDP